METVWITGTGGLIGSYLAKTSPAGLNARGLTRGELDLQDFSSVRECFQKEKPSAILHCAALSKSPACQADPVLARTLNVEVTRMLAELAAGIPFVFFSTDLVFDGQKGNYLETDPVNPLNVYAETKVLAEQIVLANPGHTVVRTSLNAGRSPAGDRAFNEEMRRAVANGQTLKLFTDEFRSPIPAEVTARAVWELLLMRATGLYHLAGAEKLSRFQIGQLLATRWKDLHPKIEAGSARDYRGAPRPPDTSFDCRKIQRLLSFSLPAFGEWLVRQPADAI
jgi:dTDP-4-dehydrorhamnose reductase